MRRQVVLLLSFLAGLPACAQVRVWEGVLELPVYEEGAPDPNPPFDQFAINRFSYPYTLRRETTDRRRLHSLRSIYLENEYLKCSVLPDIGGHVYTCIDKVSGQPMFYANPSIKKANIGYRGAWAAFGIEFNFPVSHNWVSMSPVDFASTAHQDGSASITVGNIDRVYGMEWSVELILRPGSTVLEQRVHLGNRSDARQRFYWWNNAAVRVWDDSRIEYPMRYAAAHGFAEVQKWPIDAQGKDLRIIKNQTDGPVSLFVHGSREGFMGIWHPHTNAGTAHYARYDELPAKKIWSWGVDADGLDWRKALSDDNSAYAEVQAGLFRNQETYAFLEPHQHIDFSEYWMPVRGTGGISRANLAGVVHLERQGDSLVIALNVNRRFPAATLQVSDGPSLPLSDKEDLAPERTWKKAFHIPDGKHNYCFELKDSGGAVLLRQTEGQYDWAPESDVKVGPQSNYAFPDEAGRTEDDWLQAGETEELNGDKLSALETYGRALKKFPASFELLKFRGRLATSLRRFEDALPDLLAAQARNTTDGEISYYLGIAQEGVGHESDALDAYEAALRSPEHRGAAAFRLAEWNARQRKFDDSRDFFAKSLKSIPDDLRAQEERVAIFDAVGQSQQAAKQAKELLKRFPLSAFLHEEADDPDLAHLAADPYRVLGVAAQFARLGLYRKALAVLSRNYPSVPADQVEPGIGRPQDNPLVAYFEGYCREKLGQSGAEDFARASRQSALYIFPDTLDDKMVLEAALGFNADDATAHYLLGTWFFSRAMTASALREWEVSRSLIAHRPVLDASLGLALLHQARDFARALSAFEDGIQNDPKNTVNYSGAVTAMALLGKTANARVQTLERYPDNKHMPASLLYELALGRAEAGDFGGATALFHDRFFGREEGGTNVRQVWIEVKLEEVSELAKRGHCTEALEGAKALGLPVTGLAFTQDGLAPILDSARTSVLLAQAYAACGHRAEAAAELDKASQADGSSDLVWAWAAAKRQDGYDPAKWMDRLNAAILHAEGSVRQGNARGWWMYTAGILRTAAGEKEQGQAELREALLLPEIRMSHHFARLALTEATLR